MNRYPLMSRSLDLGFTKLRNRVLMGSMHLGLEELPDGHHRIAAFYAERAKGGVGLIVTGGIAPNAQGRPMQAGAALETRDEAARHQVITEAVQAHGAKIALQILHFGRYSYQPDLVAPSPIRAPINSFTPKELSGGEVEQTISDFVRCARLAKFAGYDGVEIMGSEGYLINEFITARTNRRDDQWGGSYANRIRFPTEIVRRVREAVGSDFIIIYRLSMLDLVEGGSTFEEVVELAQRIEEAGATIINTGIGWHEARIPTIATKVPRAAFGWVTKRLKGHVSLPLVASNRINTPEIVEALLAQGACDMVSMARPFLADPDFVIKAQEDRATAINTCIACNQACIDHTFSHKVASCLVNPRACHETEIVLTPTTDPRRLAVVGAGPAGLAFARTAASRGHHVTVFEASDKVGGQFNVAKTIPGKEEFYETLRYFAGELIRLNVDLRLNTLATIEDLLGFDQVILATGVKPGLPSIDGIDHPKVISYLEAIADTASVGPKVAIIGAGGIGFDVAEKLSQTGRSASLDPQKFYSEWGIDTSYTEGGGISEARPEPSAREIWLLQRKHSKVGADLGKTTGWIHRAGLLARGIKMLPSVTYERIDDLGLHISVKGQRQLLLVDTVVLCAGQDPQRDLLAPLQAEGVRVHLIGGADMAADLDAKRAIHQGTVLACSIEGPEHEAVDSTDRYALADHPSFAPDASVI